MLKKQRPNQACTKYYTCLCLLHMCNNSVKSTGAAIFGVPPCCHRTAWSVHLGPVAILSQD